MVEAEKERIQNEDEGLCIARAPQASATVASKQAIAVVLRADNHDHDDGILSHGPEPLTVTASVGGESCR